MELLDRVIGLRQALHALRVVVPTPAERAALAPGVVGKPETLNYRTMKPERDGLFDEAVFGPFVDTGPAAPEPETPIEAFQWGRMRLAVPVLHPAMLRREPAGVAERAGVAEAELVPIAHRDPAQPFDAVDQIGARCPELVVTELAVLPGPLRPMRRLEGDRWATTDLNDHYRRVVNRSNRLARLVELKAPEIITRNEARMLHEAVAALFENDLLDKPVLSAEERPLQALWSGFTAAGGVDAIGELDRLVAVRPDALAGPLPFRLRSAAAHLYALGFDLRPAAADRAAPPTAPRSGTVPVPY